jgi:rhomboid protease GluP
MTSPTTAAQLLPLIDRLRTQVPRVPVTLTIIVANLLVFAATLNAGAGLWHSPNGVQLAWGANFGPATQDGEWWRLGSALFLHFGLLHLGMNMWALWDGGHLVERMYGHARFVLIYFVAGLAGNLASLVVQGSGAVSGGASGAIFGVYGALLAYVWRERGEMHAADFRWLFWGASAFTALAIAFGFVIPGIDNAAHLGGLMTGVLAGLALIPRRGRLVAATALVLAVAGLIVTIPAPKYRWSEEKQARGEIRDFLGEDAAITARWQTLLREGQRGNLSFDELAGNIESEIADRYEASFEDLSALKLSGAAPSAATVTALQHYAQQRRDASRALAEGLRARDPAQIRKAMEQASRAAAGGRQDPQPNRPAR